MKELTWLDDLKLRASWGQTGNQEISNLARYTIYAPNYGTTDSFGGQSYGTAYDITGSNGGGTLPSGFKRNQIGNDNIKWETTVDKKKVGHKLIRRVSLDQFYALVTGQEDAFYKMCMVLPSVIQKAVDELEGSIVPHDTVIDELKALAKKQSIDDENLAVAMAVYMLGFGSYSGFKTK